MKIGNKVKTIDPFGKAYIGTYVGTEMGRFKFNNKTIYLLIKDKSGKIISKLPRDVEFLRKGFTHDFEIRKNRKKN